MIRPFVWAKARLEDIAREVRIDRYASMALLAEKHGHTRAALIHAKDMYREMNLRSPEQKARMAKKSAKAIRGAA